MSGIGRIASERWHQPPLVTRSNEVIAAQAKPIGDGGPDLEVAPGIPSYSMRLIRPFLKALPRNRRTTTKLVRALDAYEPDDRVPIFAAHQLIEQIESMTAQPGIGLKAAVALEPGDLGALEYAVRSAATVEESLTIAGRYLRFVDDALAFSSEVIDGRVFVRLANLLGVPRSVSEFQLAAVLAMVRSAWPDRLCSDLDVWLMATRPVDASAYLQVFAPARIHFASSFSGFSFDAVHMTATLSTADSKLHEVIAKHLELVLNMQFPLHSYTERVRSLLIRELPEGNATAERLAHLLHVSMSTLGRRLESEGTTFSLILDDLRRCLALGYLTSRDLSVSEIASSTGFSQTGTFHRAFRRWTGKTPLEYRRERRQLGAWPRR